MKNIKKITNAKFLQQLNKMKQQLEDQNILIANQNKRIRHLEWLSQPNPIYEGLDEIRLGMRGE